MQATQLQSNIWRNLAWCTATVVCSLLAFFCVMSLWKADLHVPFLYDGDSVLTLSWIKGIMDNGWYLHNRFLGAPFGQELYDFPMADSLNFVTVKLLALLCGDAAVVHNLFYILGFPLTALTTFLVLRHFKVSPAPALVVSILFAFIPTHFLRNFHLFLSAYYLIPPMMMIVLWTYLGEAPFFRAKGKLIASLIICLLVSSQGIYYAFFGCFFLLVAGLSSSLSRRALQPLGSSLILIAVISLGVLANVTPNLLYKQRCGPNPEVAHRFAVESESYGLKITQMLLPIADHRAGLLARVRKAYDESYMPLVNENHTVSLGLTASIGLLVLLGRLLLWNKARSAPDLQAGLAMLAVVAILLATIGGFSALFSVYITPQIRCWNRINLYIGFFSLFSLALLYERSLRACGSSLLPRVALHVSLGVVLVLGVLDQTSRSFIPDYPSLVRQYQSDRAFVRRIEGSAPAGAMIFQLPYFPYPEGGPRVQLRNYESLKGYVHSCHLRWSHGAMKGREADDVIRGIAVLPLGQMVRALAVAGFSGIYLDRRGYTDHGAGIELELTRMLSAPPLVSEDGHRSYFSIIDFADVHRQNLSSAEWEAARQSVLYPVAVEFREGCHYGDDPPENPARWCAAAACLRLHNPRSQAQRVRLEMVCEAHQPQAHLALRGELLSRDYEIRDGRLVISEELTVPPGFHPLRLSCDAQRFPPTGDPRGLVFYLRSVVLRELP